MTKKISETKLNEAGKALQKIAGEIANFNKVWQTLTPQEKAVIGGVVFHVVCPWNDFSLIGTIVDRPLGARMVNSLVNFFNSPPREGAVKQDIPSIMPATTIGKKDEYPN